MLGQSKTSIAVCICRMARKRETTNNIVINVTMQASLAALMLGVYIHVCGICLVQHWIACSVLHWGSWVVATALG